MQDLHLTTHGPAIVAGASTFQLVQQYEAEIQARRDELENDLTMFRARLGDLAQLDPLDFTGLAQLYRAHVHQIESLLEEFDAAAVAP